MAEVRPIDANEVLQGIEELKRSTWYTWNPGGLVERITKTDAVITVADLCIRDAKTLDYAPVRHGSWIDNTKLIYGFPDVQFNCSECDYVSWNQTECLHYCPNCGAKMDGGKKNGCTD